MPEYEFYREVDRDLKNKLSDISPDEDGTMELVINAINTHVSEVHSPTTIGNFAKKRGRDPRLALDILVNHERTENHGTSMARRRGKSARKGGQQINKAKTACPVGLPEVHCVHFAAESEQTQVRQSRTSLRNTA